MRHWLGVGMGVVLLVLVGSGLCSFCSAPDDDCTHYVDNYASADGDGSLDAPWDNIAGHVNDLAPGNVLCVRGDSSPPGRVYTESVILLERDAGTHSGTQQAPITVRTYPGTHVVLRTSGARYILVFRDVDHWQFDGFAFDKESTGQYAIYFRGANSNVVRNCEVHNSAEDGIHFDSGDHNVIENCRIHDIDAGPYKDGTGVMIVGGRGNLIRNNEFYDCRGDGVHFYPYSEISGNIIENNHFYTTLGRCSENAVDIKVGGLEETIVRGNVMHGFRYNDGRCGGSGGGIGSAIVIHEDATNVLVESNEIYDSASGIVVKGSDVQIVNNIVYDLATDANAWANIGVYVHNSEDIAIVNNSFAGLPNEALWIGEGVSGLDLRNNLFYDTGQVHNEHSAAGVTADYNGWFSVAGRLEGPHDVVGRDPQFVSSGDYHLRAVSPAVDAGDGAKAPAQDFDGNPRPYGSGVDLGAFEVQAPTPVTDLRASEGVTTTDSVTVTLIWTTPGRVGQPGAADHYELRYCDQSITQESWSQATVVDASIVAGQPGEPEDITVNLPWDGSGYLYFALRVFDADFRGSEVSNPAFWPFESVFLSLVSAATTSNSSGRIGCSGAAGSNGLRCNSSVQWPR